MCRLLRAQRCQRQGRAELCFGVWCGCGCLVSVASGCWTALLCWYWCGRGVGWDGPRADERDVVMATDGCAGAIGLGTAGLLRFLENHAIGRIWNTTATSWTL
jgi:hypothetical protein